YKKGDKLIFKGESYMIANGSWEKKTGITEIVIDVDDKPGYIYVAAEEGKKIEVSVYRFY
ncbi:MAG: hypothetical protein C0392_03875, partial [Syntrophus sp. (in: bacteria)]|nr:hypothetical protein [Syntrophus sp. (in: bacteria)]